MRFIIAGIACTLLVLAGCSSRDHMTKNAPLYDLVVENRHDSLVSGWLKFGDVDSVAGGPIKPGDIGSIHQDLAGGVPEKAVLRMNVAPKGVTDVRSPTWTEHTSDVAVRSQLPKNFHDGVFYFIIQQDLSLRLVILTHEQWETMQAQGKRPD